MNPNTNSTPYIAGKTANTPDIEGKTENQLDGGRA
jgi:hypothetical protein